MNNKKNFNGRRKNKVVQGAKRNKQQSTKGNERAQSADKPKIRRRARRNNRRKSVSASHVDTNLSDALPVGVNPKSSLEKRIKSYSVSGPDARDPNERVNLADDEIMSGQTGSISNAFQLNDEAVRAYACGIISHALSIGWRATLDVNQQSYPYWAAQYIMTLMYNVANGNDSALPSVLPAFFRDTLAMIKPKSGHRYYSGDLSYKWKTTGSVPTLPDHFNFPVGAGTYSYWIPKPSGATADGFPEMQAPIAPTGDLPSQAFNSLINFANEKTIREAKEYNPWTPSTTILAKSPLYRETTAFAQIVPQIGQACGQASFQAGVLHATKAKCPKFAVFNGETVFDQTIAWRHGANWNGDACSLVSSLLLQVNANEYYNVDSPSFKYIDFYDIANRILVAMSLAWTNMYRTNTNVSIPTDLGMTLTQFLCMLRAVLLGYYNMQHYGHSVLPIRANSSVPNKIMLPLISSTPTVNGYPYNTMQMPLYIRENLKAMRMSAVEDQYNPVTGKTVAKHKHYRVPVLFVYKDSSLDWTSYVYSDGSNPIKMFTGAGAAISIIDGSFGNVYYDISDSQNVNALLAQWNAVSNALSPCIQQLSATAIDNTANALTNVQTTRFVDVYRRNGDEDRRGFSNSYVFQQLEKSSKGPTLQIFNKGIIDIIAEQPVLRPLFSVAGWWMTPELPLFDGETGTGYGKITIAYMRVYYREPFSMELVNTAAANAQRPLSLVAVTASYVQNCAKTYNAEDGETVKLLQKVADSGDGSFFLSVVKTFAIPMAKAAGISAAQSLIAQLS